MNKNFICFNVVSLFLLTSCAGISPKVESNPYVYVSVDDDDYENMEALQLTKVMGNGINLGNTMDACGGGWIGFKKDPLEYEHCWGMPETQKVMFTAYKEAGFDCVRIPVSWLNAMDIANGDYTIDSRYINRVAKIVNWALEADLFVILNDHHDYEWCALFGPEETREEAYRVFDAIWDQVGTYFKDYSYKLIFEAANEQWGAGFYHAFSIGGKEYTTNTEVSVWSSSAAEFEAFQNKCYDIIEEIGQYYVDKIRAQGGKNDKRFLLMPGYDTSMTYTADKRYKMPKDPMNSDIKKLLVSVHYYGPPAYSILSEDAGWANVANSWGTAQEVKEQNDDFAQMQRFTNEGYGVIVGEYAVAMLKQSDGTYVRKNDDIKWMTNVLDNCDKYNYCPLIWECNDYFKRGWKRVKINDWESQDVKCELGFVDSDVAELFKSRSYAVEKAALTNE